MKRTIGWLTVLTCLFALLVGCAPASRPSDGQGGTTSTTATTTATTTTTTTVTEVATTTTGTVPSSTTSVTTTKKPTTATTKPAAATSEMRAVWMAFSDIGALIGNKSVADAQKALDAAMKQIADFGLNTVIFHVRANSDAYYPSKLFKPAKSVKSQIDAGFDPLAYAITAAHKNGLKLHAWVNPYRIGADASYAACDDTFTYNNRHYYIPTSVEAQALILNGVRELMAYDIDGVQFDDYFYPAGACRETTAASFEADAYAAYRAAGGTGTVGDWRRANVNALVRSVYGIVHQKKGCVFGISPASDVTKNFSEMYADIKLWMRTGGYVDYICPQIYYGFHNATAAFDKQTDLWCGYARHASVSLYVGVALYKTGIYQDTYAGASGKTEWVDHTDVMARSVTYLRQTNAVGGFMLFRYEHLTASAVRETSFDKTVAQKELDNLKKML